MEYICIYIYIYRGEFSVFSINTYKLWDLMDTMVIELWCLVGESNIEHADKQNIWNTWKCHTYIYIYTHNKRWCMAAWFVFTTSNLSPSAQSQLRMPGARAYWHCSAWGIWALARWRKTMRTPCSCWTRGTRTPWGVSWTYFEVEKSRLTKMMDTYLYI